MTTQNTQIGDPLPVLDSWTGYGDWIGHPACGAVVDSKEQFVIDHRDEFRLIGYIQDNDASYSYDDWALCYHDGKFWLLATSGCSCPSPTETWRVEIGPASLGEVKAHVDAGNYKGYTLMSQQYQDFCALIDKARALVS